MNTIQIPIHILENIKHILECWAPVIQKHGEEVMIGYKESDMNNIIDDIHMPKAYYTIDNLINESK